MPTPNRLPLVGLIALLTLTSDGLERVGGLNAQPAGDPLERGFEDPPASARPRVWWHWMNGNITKEGITRDLEWMARVGIGAFRASMRHSGATRWSTSGWCT